MVKKIKIFFQALFKPMPLVNNFKDYDEYWKKRGFCAPSLRRAKLISQYVDPNSSILDIGCGDGTVIDYLSKNNKPNKIIGIDISGKAIDYVKKRGYEAFKMDILSNKFIDFLKKKKFNYIIITEVLEHVQDPEKVMLAIKNHFNKAIFISIPNAGFFMHRIRLMLGKFPIVMVNEHIKEHIRFWTLQDFLYWINYLGFKVDKIMISSALFFKSLSFLEELFPSFFGYQLLFKISKNKEN